MILHVSASFDTMTYNEYYVEVYMFSHYYHICDNKKLYSILLMPYTL